MPVLKKLFILTTLICLGCFGENADELAIIGSRVITINEFVNHYKSIKQKINLPDNGQTRLEIFRNMIDEALLISEAEQRGYQNDEAGQHQVERIKLQELLNAYLQEKIFSSIQISDDNLKSLYIKLNTKIKARHLYASSRAEADILYQKLINGKTFDELAKDVFKDPQLRDTGGSLGYFSVDEMDPGFEDATFDLKIGQVSKPVRTAQGYSIIQVQDRITKPLLIESEYAKHKFKLEDYWHHRMRKKSAQTFSDSIRKKLDLSFNEPVIKELLTKINTGTIEFASTDIKDLSDNQLLVNEVVVKSQLGNWDLKTLREHAKFTSEKQKKWIKNQENLENFIAGLIVRNYIVSEAQRLNLQKSSEYESAVMQKSDDYLYQRMIDTITDEVIIPEDTLLAYYQKHKNQFVIPPKIRLSEIVLNNEKKADEVKQMLFKDSAFDDLIEKYSVREWSAENNGDIGSFRSEELGIYTDRIMSLEIDQWTGPVKMNDKYVFFKCTGKFAAKAQTFDEACPAIVKNIKPIWKNTFKEKTLDEIRSHTRVVTFPEKLKTIRLN